LLIHRRINLKSVQDEEDFHRRVASALVPIHERMVFDEGETQSRSLLRNCGIEFLTTNVMRG
jgi:hypothetical protein